MEIKTPKERILLLEDSLTEEEAKAIAWKNKANAFGTINQLSNFLSRPKDEDFTLVYKEHRYIPFLHLKGSAKYVYDRTVTHEWETSGPEVKSLTLQGKDYDSKDGVISATVVEHCNEEAYEELFLDSLSSQPDPSLSRYIVFQSKTHQLADVETLSRENVVIPPKARPSAYIREIASKMIQNIDADTIIQEDVAFQTIDTYYHSLFAFKYKWLSKNKESVVIVDGLTKKVTYSQDEFKQMMGKVFDYDFLFDIGENAAAILIPGGGIALKLAKKYIDVTKKK